MICCFGFVANPGGFVAVCCFGLVANSDGSMVLVVVLAVFFFFFFFWVYGRPRGFVVVCCFGFLVVIVFVLVGGLGDCGGCFGCCCWFQFWLVVVVVEFRLLDLDCSILGLGLNDRAWVVEKERQRGERVCSFIFILWTKLIIV